MIISANILLPIRKSLSEEDLQSIEEQQESHMATQNAIATAASSIIGGDNTE
jgi:hypothetical protein